jgi:beta-barrel assembly-enhancing protease
MLGRSLVNRVWRSGAFLMLVLCSCVGTTTQLAPIPKGAIETEQEKQRELVLTEHTQQQARLDNISFPVLATGTSLCPRDLGLRLGLSTATLNDYDSEYRSAAARVLGVSDTLTILSVTSAGPAARVGLQARDKILGVGNKSIDAGSASPKRFAELISEYGSSRAVPLRVHRGGQQQTVVVHREQVCDYGAVVYNSDEMNAYADGRAIYFTSTMMRFVNDDELTVVVSHEIAHNAMGHIKAKKKNSLFGAILGALGDVALASRGVNTGGYYASQGAKAGAMTFSQDFEREADYVGIYALALAGSATASAPNFWRRMAVADPKQIGFASSHPTSAERFVRLEQVISEVERKLASHQPLQPNLAGTPASIPEPEPQLATAIPGSSAAVLPDQPQPRQPQQSDFGSSVSKESAPTIQPFQPPAAQLPLSSQSHAPMPVNLSQSGQVPDSQRGTDEVDQWRPASTELQMEPSGASAGWLGQPHGRVYYDASCQAALELPEPIYFATEEDAQRLGYQRSLVQGC